MTARPPGPEPSARYAIPAGLAQVELRFRNSRFIGTSGPAATVEEARRFIESVRSRFPDAGHHVYAFEVGYAASVTHGMSDAGEPSGTAGRPVLAVVRGADLGDVVVVVSRYFGGTKLGTGGLVRAYTETAQAVLAAVPRREKVLEVGARLALPYEFYQSCRSLIERLGARIETEEFGGRVEVRLRIDAAHLTDLREGVQGLTSGRVSVEQVA